MLLTKVLREYLTEGSSQEICFISNDLEVDIRHLRSMLLTRLKVTRLTLEDYDAWFRDLSIGSYSLYSNLIKTDLRRTLWLSSEKSRAVPTLIFISLACDKI